MGEQNPLLVATAPKSSEINKNSKGRPCTHKSTAFSPQPISMVSQLLKKMITENKILFPLEENCERNAIDSISIEDEGGQNYTEADQIEDFTCPIPKKEYSNKRKEGTEPKEFSCDYANCTYSTKLSSNFRKHTRTHTGEKPYLCDRCSFRTSFSNSLKVHRRLHTAERPYQCPHCDYKCNSISNLKKHLHTKHKDDNFKCK